MPWDHCEVEFILDDEPCPSCGLTKAAWSVQIDKTREFVVGTKQPKIKGPRASWSVLRELVGETVELRVEAHGLEAGAKRTLRILEHDADGKHDPVGEVEASVGEDGLLSAEWRCRQVTDDDDWNSRYELETSGRTWAEFFFEVDLPTGTIDSGKAEDELFRPYGQVGEQLLDAQGRPRVDVPYVLEFPDGSVEEGRTDAEGRVVSPTTLRGRYDLRVSEAPRATAPPRSEPIPHQLPRGLRRRFRSKA
jgi:hypothetical protein